MTASRWTAAFLLVCLVLSAGGARAQYELPEPQVPPMTGPHADVPAFPPLRLENTSWTYIPSPMPREFQVHDYVMIRVNEMSRTNSDGEMQRRRNLLYDAILNDWVVLDGLKSIKPSPQSDGDPRIKGQLSQLYRAQGELETSERMSLNISAEIVDILPNGNLILEAHEHVRNNNEHWEVSLTGSCRPEDVSENNMVLSERIVGLEIYKRELGHVRDSYKRGWLVRWLDQFSPF